MSGKRYYWLKLRGDFFSSKRIKKLRRLAGGDTFTIIYLKMQLKALQSDGVLQWTGLEDDFAAELALDLDEEPDNVAVTLQYLLSCGLAETDDNINFFLPYVVENTGSETASTQRVREYRARKALQCNTDETQVKRIGNVEIEIEKESELEKEKDKKKRTALDELQLSKPVKDALGEFVRMRKQMKSPMTQRAINLLVNKLRELAADDETQIAIINQSILNGWKSVYPLDERRESRGRKLADSTGQERSEFASLHPD